MTMSFELSALLFKCMWRANGIDIDMRRGACEDGSRGIVMHT